MGKDRYRHDGKAICIDIHVKSAKQLFDYRDPAPFRERDLDDEFEEYVVSTAEEFSLGTNFKIAIQVGEPEDPTLDVNAIREAVRSHFEYKCELMRKHMKRIFRTSQFSLAIGLIVLVLCLTVARLLNKSVDSDAVLIAREGFVILGWVAMWRPIEAILYDWWPQQRRIQIFRNLMGSPVEVKFL